MIWTIDGVGAGGCDSDGGTRTALMAWMTPFEAFTSGITTRAVPLRTILPPLKEAHRLTLVVLDLQPLLCPAVAAAAGMRLPTT